MKSALTSLAVILLAATLSAQFSPLAFGLSFTPKLTWPQFDDAELGAAEPRFGFDLQSTVSFRLTGRLSLVSGVVYSLDRMYLRDYTLTLGVDQTNQGGVDVFNSWYLDEVAIQTLGVPLHLRYQLGARSEAWYLRAGYCYAIPIQESVATQLWSRGQALTAAGSSPFREANDHFDRVSLGVGYTVVLGNRTRLNLEPTVAYTLNRLFVEKGITTDLGNNVRLLDVGLRVGILL